LRENQFNLPTKVSIIGAGIAGLSAGCYLQKSGFDTEIFEAHNLPGGLCTSWNKDGYLIDGCLHWLMGTHPSSPVYRLWNEIIDMDSLPVFVYDEFFRIQDASGKEIVAYADLERLREELKSKAPEDRALVDEFVNAARKLGRMKMRMDKAPELYSARDKLGETLSYLPYLNLLIRYSKMKIHDFAARCKNPLLRNFFEYSFTSEMPVLFIMMTFSWLDGKNAGYPVGGSLKFAQLFEKKYLEQGGKIRYNSRVTGIITEKNGKRDRAAGIVTEKGEESRADIVISCADGYSTIFGMLGGRYADKRIQHYYESFQVFPSFFLVSLGVSRTFGNVPSRVIFPLDKPFRLDPEKVTDHMNYRISSYDPTLAPEGKTLIMCLAKTFNSRYWMDLRKNDYRKYSEEKQRIADFYIDQLDRKLGGIRENLEMTDIATPATLHRYTHNWKGSVEGWMVTRETGFDSLPKVLPGLDDFYMAGQWVEPGGGVPAVFFSGRNLAQIIAGKYGQGF